MALSVLQDWVMELGLRHQGVLLGAVRGCDSVPKEDAAKAVTRCLRGTFLRSYHPWPSSFIDRVTYERMGSPEEGADVARGALRRTALIKRMEAFFRNCDHHPQHYVAHLMHAAEIVGYKHPDGAVRDDWLWFYRNLIHGLHVGEETEEELDQRLGATEEDHAALSRALPSKQLAAEANRYCMCGEKLVGHEDENGTACRWCVTGWKHTPEVNPDEIASG